MTVCGGLGLFMAEADPARVACITGTKGKSTTTALAVHLLTGLGHRARAGGNIGLPPWDPSPEPDPDYWVIETSSFQVPDIVAAPHVVAVTSLSPDHLDWHGTVERYYADKLSLCTKPGVALALADGSDEQLRAHAALLGPHLRWVTAADVERDAAWSASLGLPGPHNARNASRGPSRPRGHGDPGGVRRRADRARAARASAGCPAGATRWAASRASSSSTTACRRTCCRRRRRCSAFEQRPVALLVGGHDRGVDYSPLGRTIARPHGADARRHHAGQRSAHRRRVRAAGDGAVEVIDAASLDAAVEAAFGWAGSGAVVLLSPAAPSFGRFGDYRERSAAFAAAAGRCGQLS